MTDQPSFTGTPDDWWEQAERITAAEAEERTMGSWYITQVRTAGDTKPGYRLSTPSRPANQDRKANKSQHESTRVRRLMSSPVPAWIGSLMVFADTAGEEAMHRLPWVRKNSGRWQCLADARPTINDHAMAELNPSPAIITEDTGEQTS